MRYLALTLTVVSVVGLFSTITGNLPLKLVYNGSESSRVGFYWIDKVAPQLGDFVLIKAPKNVRELIKIRHYLPAGVPLIKRIVAVAGDEICRHGANILVNGSGLGVAKPEDILGRSLLNWQGCKTLSQDQIFVLQFHPDSFDGRYFGPVNRSLIIGRATFLQFP